jgi:hypothetical protein
MPSGDARSNFEGFLDQKLGGTRSRVSPNEILADPSEVSARLSGGTQKFFFQFRLFKPVDGRGVQ